MLTDDGPLAHRLTDPRNKQPKTYLAQVEGVVTEAALDALRHGLDLKDGRTLPAQAQAITEPPWLWRRDPPVRFRQHIPTAWIELTLREGRNRQVRRMTAAAGLPTLRLIRVAVADFTLGNLAPGDHRVV